MSAGGFTKSGAQKFSTAERLGAFGVHVFTATGAALGLLALLAATRADWTWMFIWLGVALAVDGVDGPLARKLNVAERLPHWSGDNLDLVIDFVTYVLVPAYAIVAGGLLPDAVELPLGLLIAGSGALYCADTRMKTTDNYFRGFPVLWNAVAFYLFLLKLPAWIAAAAVICLVILTFAPFRFVHPVRVVRWRPLTLALLAIWLGLGAVAIVQDMKPEAWVTFGLCAAALYFVTLGFLPKTSKAG